MKSGSALVRIAWILLGLLGIGSVAFELGRPNTNEEPYAGSVDPSGAAAFIELLRRDGYQVQIDSVVPNALEPDVLALAFVERQAISEPTALKQDASNSAFSPQKPPTSEAPGEKKKGPQSEKKDTKSGGDDEDDSDSESDRDEVLAPQTVRMIADHLRQGGNAMILGFKSDVEMKVAQSVSVTVTDLSSRTYHVVLPPGVGVYSEDLDSADAALPAWLVDKQAFANLDQIGAGRSLILDDGEIAMNSCIDQGDNARILLDQVHLLAPKGSDIVVIDGSVSGEEGGLLEALGPWARGAQLQIILLGIVIVYALGKRFGLADETRRVQRGDRDLLDGIADTYDRGRAAKAGLGALLQDADRAVRRHLKLASDAPVRKRNELLPTGVAQAMTACEHGMMQDINANEALTLARHLETELELFLHRRKPSAKRIRRRVNSA